MSKALTIANVRAMTVAGRVSILPAYVCSLCALALYFLDVRVEWVALFVLLTILHFRKLPSSLIVFVLLHGIVFSLFVLVVHQNASFLQEGEARLTVASIDKVKWNGDRFTAIATVEHSHQREKISLTYRAKTESEKKAMMDQVTSTSMCKFTGIVSRPKERRNPHTFDYATYLTHQHIHFTVEIQDSLSCKEKPYLIDRSRFIDTVRTNMGESPWTKYVLSLVLGDRTMFSETEVAKFQEIGIIHLLAISGLHISVLVATFSLLSTRIGFVREHIALVLLLLLPLYMYVTGNTPPVVRAGLTGMLVIVALLMHQKIQAFYLFFIVVTLFVYYSPNVLLQVSFQLSFIITGAILLSLSILEKKTSFILVNLLVTFICSMASLFIMPIHFYTFSLSGFVSNLLFVPYFTIVLLPISFLLFAVSFISTEAVILLGNVLNVFLHAVDVVGTFFYTIPWGLVHIGAFSFFQWLLLFGCILLFFYSWQLHHRIALLYFCFIVLVLSFQILPFSGKVTMLDVGQGDALVIREPFSLGVTVIDTGGFLQFEQEEWQKKESAFSTGVDIIIPYLRGEGVQWIEQLVLTHSDADHIQGALQLFQEIEVKKMFITKQSEDNELMQQVLMKAKAKAVPVFFMEEGNKLPISSQNTLRVLHPRKDREEGSSNNASVVLYGEIGGIRWLFTGDLEEEGESGLLHRYPNVQADVLKVSHHGSNSSTKEEFVRAIRPRVAWISAGVSNRYGHPHKEVVDVLAKHKVKVFRTDQHGAVEYRYDFFSNGTFWTFYPYDATNRAAK